jgi:hypothetical protein
MMIPLFGKKTYPERGIFAGIRVSGLTFAKYSIYFTKYSIY